MFETFSLANLSGLWNLYSGRNNSPSKFEVCNHVLVSKKIQVFLGYNIRKCKCNSFFTSHHASNVEGKRCCIQLMSCTGIW